MGNYRLSRLDKATDLHICEPVLASVIVLAPGSIRNQVISGVLEKALPEGIISELLENGAEKAVEFVGERFHQRDELKLTSQMYLVLGATTLGLYELPNSWNMGLLGPAILYLPEATLRACMLKQPRFGYGSLQIQFANGQTLKLLIAAAFRKEAEHFCTIVQQQQSDEPQFQTQPQETEHAH